MPEAKPTSSIKTVKSKINTPRKSGKTASTKVKDENHFKSDNDGEMASGVHSLVVDKKNQLKIDTMFTRKRKLDESVNETENKSPNIKKLKPVSVVQKPNPVTEKQTCRHCFQSLDANLEYYKGHPPNAVPELNAMLDDKVLLITGGEEVERVSFKLTQFNVFCKEGHLCPFDTGLVEKNAQLFISGILKCVIDDSVGTESGVPMYSEDSIVEWWISGYDGGEKAVMGLSTQYAEYYLQECSPAYLKVMQPMFRKVALSKAVIEFLFDFFEQNPTFEDLMSHLETCPPPPGSDPYTEDDVMRFANYILDQVINLDANEPEEPPLIRIQCMRTLVGLVGYKFTNKTFGKKSVKIKKERRKAFTMATTTPLVKMIFESFFPEQLDQDGKAYVVRRKRCGICAGCQMPDCGTCSACLSMLKFGGAGKTKQACVQRVCPNMAVEEANDSDLEEDDEKIIEAEVLPQPTHTQLFSKKSKKSSIPTVDWKWITDGESKGTTSYKSVLIGKDLTVSVGDFVMVKQLVDGLPPLVARVITLNDDGKSPESPVFHAQFFIRGSDTVLGECSDPREIFITDGCESLSIFMIIRKAVVEHRETPPDWSLLGGLDNIPATQEDDGKTFFFQKRYIENHARFEDPLPIDLDLSECPACKSREIQEMFKTPLVQDNGYVVMWKGESYTIGDCVLLEPSTFEFEYTLDTLNAKKDQQSKLDDNKLRDPTTYPEYYRKAESFRGSNVATQDPFILGHITAVHPATKNGRHIIGDIWLTVFKMYRPENTGDENYHVHDLNMVYWSYEVAKVNFKSVVGKGYLRYAEVVDLDINKWSSEGPRRFYFKEIWNPKNKQLEAVRGLAAIVGSMGKGKGGGKGKGMSKAAVISAPDYPVSSTCLKMLDVFAGCGGLSEGLHQAGLAESKWAIEFDTTAAAAYRLNNPNCTVLNEDCNSILKTVMNGGTHSELKLRLPQKGEVELLCGGPPCQGFSGMNRFNRMQYSLFKNSLVATFLSYCDYYRPKFFILENVRNFVAFKSGMVLKLTLRCLLAMNYQCTFGVLQAGNYGVPQTRRRLIILAAAPGQILPIYPEPTHVFGHKACTLLVNLNGKRYTNDISWEGSAPYRSVTIRDAMSDLPEIISGTSHIKQDYNHLPQSHFQRLIRDESCVVTEHITKDQSPLVQARIALIPARCKSDWRDLPNTVVTMSNGKSTEILQYKYVDKSKSNGGTRRRGVCSCVNKGPCNPLDRQFNTLIPWCLPHTGNRHNNWAGLYGRLDWNGYFGTTVTNPEPMGKQGRVLHPEQNRVVSVRECARSQGFPDRYKFCGNILEKHRQVGNAVPPPLARAIGLEIIKALVLTPKTENMIKEDSEKVEQTQN